MGHPKAKWDQYTEEHEGSDVWTAAVGPFYLEVIGGRGAAELCEYDHDAACVGETLWSGTLTTPCDIVDLMLLAEAELERRLRGAAETMDGKELVATPEPVETMQCRFCSTVVGTAETFEDVCASCLRESHAMRSTAISANHTPGSDCSACEACGTHCLPINSLVDGRCKCCGPAVTAFRNSRDHWFNFKPKTPELPLRDGQCQHCLQPVPGPEHADGCPYRAPAAGSREWAMAQLQLDQRAVVSYRDDHEYELFKHAKGEHIRRTVFSREGERNYVQVTELPQVNTGWRVLK